MPVCCKTTPLGAALTMQCLLTDYDDRADVIGLMSIGCELPLTPIDRKITV
jgi:hypothetical protein